MNTPNLFWPVYKNLEKELLTLSNYIHISDDQANVYSMHIAELIIRCAIEIESLSKELYSLLGGNMSLTDEEGNIRDLYFDTDCIDLLENKWHICKKEITVTAPSLYFVEDKHRIITPLYKANKRGTSGSKWKQAYQSIKHDRRNSLKKATIENLLYALGSLYILNLYYLDDRQDIGRTYLSDRQFDSRVGSDVFSTHFCRATGLSMARIMDDSCINPPISEDELNRSIYIVKYDDKSYGEMHKSFCLDSQITEKAFNSSPEIAKFISEHPEYRDKSINEICMAAGGESLLLRIVCMKHSMNNRSTRTEAVLNKHTNIYPTLSQQY